MKVTYQNAPTRSTHSVQQSPLRVSRLRYGNEQLSFITIHLLSNMEVGSEDSSGYEAPCLESACWQWSKSYIWIVCNWGLALSSDWWQPMGAGLMRPLIQLRCKSIRHICHFSVYLSLPQFQGASMLTCKASAFKMSKRHSTMGFFLAINIYRDNFFHTVDVTY